VILIPARDEAHSIAQVITEARRLYPAPIVVIDDGSQDATAAIAAAAGGLVLRLPLHLGAWGAMQTGLRYAYRQGWDLAITLDADGQHDPADIQALIAPLLTGEADVVIGACPLRVSRARRLAWHYFRGITGIALEDLTSGFRAYNRAAMERLIRPDATLLDYQDVGVLLILRRQGLRMREVPVTMRDRSDGKSHIFNSWWTVASYMVKTSLLCLAGVGGKRNCACLDED
jgi:hypothetical protein